MQAQNKKFLVFEIKSTDLWNMMYIHFQVKKIGMLYIYYCLSFFLFSYYFYPVENLFLKKIDKFN